MPTPMKFAALLGALLSAGVPAFGADLIRTEQHGDQPAQVILENDSYRMAIDPARGAAAASLVVKPSGREMLLPGAAHGTGLLADVFRDEGFAGEWRGAYDVQIISSGPVRGEVRFVHRGMGNDMLRQVTLTKSLTVAADSPVIAVTVQIEMGEGEHRHFPFRYWVHNRISVDGGATRYFLPTAQGIEAFEFAPGHMGQSLQHTVTDPPRPWIAAMADEPGGAGIAVRFDRTHPQTYYSYAKGKIITFEWGHDQYVLRRGNTWTTSFSIQTFAGLPHVDGVVGPLVGAIVTEEATSLRGSVMLTGDAGVYDVQTQYCRLPDRTWQPLDRAALTVKAGQTAHTPFDLTFAKRGSFIVRAQVRRDGDVVGEFERHLEANEPSGRYALMPLVLKTDQLGAIAHEGAIALAVDVPVCVEKVLPTDCRLVRAFTHAPVDGRTDTRNVEGGVSEWSGLHGLPAAQYREFNENNGLHITLPEGGFDKMVVRGGWTGKVYGAYESLRPPDDDAPSLCEVSAQPGAFRADVDRSAAPRRLSFFCSRSQVAPLADVTFLRVGPVDVASEDDAGPALGIGQGARVDETLHRAMAQRFGPFYRAYALSETPGESVSLAKGEFVHLITPPQDPSLGVGAVTVELRVADIKADSLVSLRVQDVLDPRREAMSADFLVAGPGTYRVKLDLPDQVFLPPVISPRLEGPIAPPPQLWLSVAFDAPATVAQANVVLHHLPRAKAVIQAGAWRMLLLRGLFSAMSEPRPWMHLTDKGPIREQITTNSLMSRYAPSLIELLETAEVARLLLPDDDVARQYHEWLYQNIDRRKPMPAPQMPATDAPRWAVLVRQSFCELRDIAQWWLDHRMTDGGYFGGGINDDTDLFQTWQCLPMIESAPLGAQLKVAAAQLSDNAWRLTLDEGINKRSMDALHAYEEGVNQLALCARWFYGDPVHFERVMISAKSTMKLMVETPDGRVHFGGEVLGIDQSRNGFEKLGTAGGYATKLFLQPLYEVAWYNGNPAVTRRFEQWGRTWADYQQPGAYVEHVDIATGKPVRTTKTARGPSDEWLALYQLTGDKIWLEPLKLGMQSQSYWGFGPSYGRSAHALVDWDEADQLAIGDHYRGGGAGYAGFFLHKDRTFLEQWLADSASWFGRYRYMHTAAEVKTDRVLNYNASTPLACYLGDAPNRNRWLNFNAVSYEGLRGEDYAALVWDAGHDRLKVALYNFTGDTLTADLRTWRLDHGKYRVRIGPDADDDGNMDVAAKERITTLQRGSTLPFSLPARQVTIVAIEQLEQLEDIRTRADLALSPREVSIKGNTVTGTVHNIGAASADVVVAVVTADGKTLATQSLGVLEAPLDLMPRRMTFTLDVPSTATATIRLVVDPASQVSEINEHNNAVTIAAEETHD